MALEAAADEPAPWATKLALGLLLLLAVPVVTVEQPLQDAAPVHEQVSALYVLVSHPEAADVVVTPLLVATPFLAYGLAAGLVRGLSRISHRRRAGIRAGLRPTRGKVALAAVGLLASATTMAGSLVEEAYGGTSGMPGGVHALHGGLEAVATLLLPFGLVAHYVVAPLAWVAVAGPVALAGFEAPSPWLLGVGDPTLATGVALLLVAGGGWWGLACAGAVLWERGRDEGGRAPPR